jgi:hypothetical protein
MFRPSIPIARGAALLAVTLGPLPGSEAIKPMRGAEIAKAVQLLDLMLEFFADDGHWTRGR